MVRHRIHQWFYISFFIYKRKVFSNEKLCFFVLFLLPATIYCQNEVTSLNLLFFDKESGSPVPHVHIVIKGENIGTISNTEGRAEYKIENRFLHRTLTVSAIGYISQDILIKKLVNKRVNKIRLEKQVYAISPVTISKLVSKSILKSAIQNIPDNYPCENHYYNGYFRTALKENNDFVRYLEASVSVFDKGFHKRRGVYAKIDQLRKSNDYDNKTLSPNDSLQFKHLNTVFSIRYKDFGDKMIKSYQSLKQDWDVVKQDRNADSTDDIHLGSITLYEEFITYNFGYGRNMGLVNFLEKSIDIYELRFKYDKNFWINFNIPVDTESFKLAKDKLNSREDIEKQFENEYLP